MGCIKTIIDTVVLMFKMTWVIIVESIKACLPFRCLGQKSVKDKLVLITGGSSGLGKCLAKEFGKRGAHVIIWGGTLERVKNTERELRAINMKVHSYCFDISNMSAIAEAAEDMHMRFGKVDILVNNAAIINGRPLIDLPFNAIDKAIKINTIAYLHVSQNQGCSQTVKHFLPTMLESNSGHIVTIASLCSYLATPFMTEYVTTKFSNLGMHTGLSEDIRALGKTGVKTTVVCPGHIKTELFKGFHNNSIIHPSLTAEYVAQKAIHAILADRDMVAMPFMNYIVILSKAILPRRALELIADYMGHTHAMDKFIGRQPLKY